MKPINEMNLAECIIALRNMPMQTYNAGYKHDIAHRIHELTRWISVDERWPELEDVREKVLVYSSCGRYWKGIDGPQTNHKEGEV